MTPQKLIHSSKSWTDFVEKISTFQDKKRGTHFEWFVKFYLLSSPKYRLYYDEVWHSSEFQHQIEHVSKLNLPIPEQGYDLIGLLKDGSYEIIQCKYKNNINKNIVYEDIDSSIRVAVASPTKKFVKSIKMCSNLQGITRDKDINNQAVKINGIFGGDFESLNKKDFKNIKKIIDDEIPVFNKVKLHPHQTDAVKLIKNHFIDDRKSRGQIIHACGTGKTLTSYYAYKELKPQLAIYLVPSLQLITQTLDEWSKESLANNEGIAPFIVCSDVTNEKIEENDPGLWLQELGIKVSNKIEEIEQFLKSKKLRKVIFATYQSGKSLAKNLSKLNIVPDLCFFDEAHNTTSSKTKLFGHLLSDENLQIKQRLFLTATPKKITLSTNKYFSMDDENIYGEVIDEITFKDAIEDLGMLNDYRIITQVISNEEVKLLLKDNPFVTDKEKLPEEAELKLIASALTIKKTIKNKKIKNIISFHSRVNRARLFSEGLNNVNQEIHVNVFHVSGKQSGTIRQRILSEFSKKSPSIVTNAKCLSEGVDVPVVDAVIFVDPKQSKISITQAIGRALRKPKNKEKGISYIIIPTIIDTKNPKDIDESYQEILMVLRSMSEHDGRIVEYFRLVKEGKKPKIKFIEIATEFISKDFNLEAFSNDLHIKSWDRVSKLGRRPFQQAREFAQQSSFNTKQSWSNAFSNGELPLDLPSEPASAYKKEFIDYYDFFGKIKRKTFIEVREFARQSPYKTMAQWDEAHKAGLLPLGFPKMPRQSFTEYIDIYDFFGKEKPAEFLTFVKARQYARQSQYSSESEWHEAYHAGKLPEGMPFNPEKKYKEEFVDMYDFFGKNKPVKLIPFIEAREYARHSPYRSMSKWFEAYSSKKLPEGLPHSPGDRYKEEFIDYYDFFGNEKPIEFRSFVEAREYARKSPYNTLEKWRQAASSNMLPKDLPSKPYQTYKAEYIDSNDFFGKGKNPL